MNRLRSPDFSPRHLGQDCALNRLSHLLCLPDRKSLREKRGYVSAVLRRMSGFSRKLGGKDRPLSAPIATLGCHLIVCRDSFGFCGKKGRFRLGVQAWIIPGIARLAQSQYRTANHLLKRAGYSLAVLRRTGGFPRESALEISCERLIV